MIDLYYGLTQHSDRNSRGPRMYKAITPGTKKRRRESTSPDELDDQDEHRFQVTRTGPSALNMMILLSMVA
jgi:hypothetical protein